MNNLIKTPDQFLSYRGYKYVRFTDGTILFCETGDRCMDHERLVVSRPDLIPLSAGTIRVRLNNKKTWTKTDNGSFTAKLDSVPDDNEALAMFLGDEWEEDVTAGY